MLPPRYITVISLDARAARRREESPFPATTTMLRQFDVAPKSPRVSLRQGQRGSSDDALLAPSVAEVLCASR
jgi:hypothetical protein